MEMMMQEQTITNQQVAEQFKEINSKINLLTTYRKIFRIR
jgi:predicted CoA-binding protein